MPSNIESDLPVRHALADGWAHFAESILSSIGGDEPAQAHIAFHFGAMYVRQIVEQVVAQRSDEEAALGLGMLDAELDKFMKSQAVAVQ